MNTYINRPFTSAIIALRDKGWSYSDLSQNCGGARSPEWFYHLLNSASPWGIPNKAVYAPPKKTFAGLCSMLRISEDKLCEMIALEWYGFRLRNSSRVRAIAPALDSLHPTVAQNLIDLAKAIHQTQKPVPSEFPSLKEALL